MIPETFLPKGSSLRWLIALIAIALFGALAQAQELPRVEGLHATAFTHDSITVSWDAMPGAKFYLLFLKGQGWEFATVGTSFTFTGLKPEKKYNIRVRYLDEAANAFGKMSRKISVRTKKYIPPAPALPVVDISIQASWVDSCYEPVSQGYAFDFDQVPNAVEYHIQIQAGPKNVIDSPDWFKCIRFVPDPGVTLTIHVDAVNASGDNIASGSISVTNPAN